MVIYHVVEYSVALNVVLSEGEKLGKTWCCSNKEYNHIHVFDENLGVALEKALKVRRDSSVLFLVLVELLKINASLSFHHIAEIMLKTM